MKKVIFGVVTLSAIAAIYIINTKGTTTEETNTSTPVTKTTKIPNVNNTVESVSQRNSTSKNNTEEEKKAIEESVNKFKQTFPQLLVELKKIPMCLGQSATKEEAEKCGVELFKIQKKLSVIAGTDQEGDIENDVKSEGNTSDIPLIPMWNEEIKESMVESIEQGIPIVYKQNKCVKNAQSTGDIEACFKEEE